MGGGGSNEEVGVVAQEVTCKQARQHNGEGGSAEGKEVAQKRRRWKKREGRGKKCKHVALKRVRRPKSGGGRHMWCMGHKSGAG